MHKYRVKNYSMGRVVQERTIEAMNGREAVAISDRLMTAAHGMPGTVKGAGAKSRVLGIERLDA